MNKLTSSQRSDLIPGRKGQYLYTAGMFWYRVYAKGNEDQPFLKVISYVGLLPYNFMKRLD